MVLDTRENTTKGKSMELENCNLQMEAIIMVNLNRMRFVVKVHIHGLMERSIQGIGRKIKCMERELCTGKMEKFTLVIS